MFINKHHSPQTKGTKAQSSCWISQLRKRVRKSCTSEIQENSNSFEELIKKAKEELVYAVASQDSRYYEGDYLAAYEAVHLCIDQFHYLLHMLQPESSQSFQHIWSEPVFHIRSVLDTLAPPSKRF